MKVTVAKQDPAILAEFMRAVVTGNTQRADELRAILTKSKETN